MSLKSGSIIFPADFRDRGSQTAIKMTLSRLFKNGTIQRIANGIYYKPFHDPVLGEMLPSAEGVAASVAEREKVRIRPAGAFALHKLGFSNQVPTKLVYLTDGHPRKLKIGKASIEFKATTPKKMALTGAISGLLIIAMEDLDLEHLNETTKARIESLVERERREDLEHDLRLAPAKIYNYLAGILKKLDASSFLHGLNIYP